MTKVGGDSTVAHFACKVRATGHGENLGHDLVDFCACLAATIFVPLTLQAK